MRFTDAAGVARDLVGVLGGLEIVDEGAGGVLPHERTTPKASTDRLDLTRATTANLSPVWGLSLAAGLTKAAGRAGRARGLGVRRRRRARRRAGRRSGPHRRHPRARRSGRRADRRRPPPLRHQPHLPRRGARRHRAPRHRSRADARLRRRAGRRAAEHRGDPPPLRGRDVRRPARRTWPRSFELAPADPPSAATLAAMEAARPPRARGAGRIGGVADPPPRRLRRASVRSTARGSSTPSTAVRPRSATSTASSEAVDAVALGRGRGGGADPPGRASPRSSGRRVRDC